MDVEMFENTGSKLIEEGKSQQKKMIYGNKIIGEVNLNANSNDQSNT